MSITVDKYYSAATEGSTGSTSAPYEILLQAGVKGDAEALTQLAADFNNDFLTLTILGAYLGRWHAGHLRGLETIPVLYTRISHPPLWRVLAAYENRFRNASDLILLYLLSLSEQPVPALHLKLTFRSSLLKRWLGRRDDYLTFLAPLSRLNQNHWHWVIENLRRLNLLAVTTTETESWLFMPAPVRHYFSQRLANINYDVFNQASNDMAQLFQQVVVPIHEAAAVTDKLPRLAPKTIEVPEDLWQHQELQQVTQQVESLRHSLAALRQHSLRLQSYLHEGEQQT